MKNDNITAFEILWPEVREKAVRMVFERPKDYEYQWAELISIAGKIGCTEETPWKWVRPAEIEKADETA